MDEDNIISSEPVREHNTCSSQEILEDHNRQPPQGTPRLSSGHSSNERISKQHNFSVEEIADRYFRELAERSLLQQESRIKGYKLPQQVRKIAESLTENEVCAGDPKDLARLPATLHRLSFLNKGLTTIPEDFGRLRSLRTLLLSGNPLGEKGLDIIFKNLEFLRVLDLSDTEINSIPKTLGNMVHLRHLNLSHTRIQALPESIGSLRKLRFLDLHGCECLTSLPKNIQKLSKLEYLNLQDSEIKEPPSLQNLMLLTFLHGFVADNISSCGWPLKELENMNKLSNLQIKLRKTLGKTVARGEVLKKKDNLRNLELSYCTVNSENLSEEESKRLKTMFNQLHPHQCLESLKVEGYYGSTYPEWLSSSKLPNLQQLSLVNCKFCERLPPICELQNLKFLRIANISKLQTIDMRPQAEMPSFPSLEELHIEDMQDLEYWSAFEAGDLPLLRTFSLRRCPKLKHLPGGLEHCKMLATMEVTEAEQLQVIGNLLVQELLVVAMQNLTTVSNLPLMKVFTITSCPILRDVSGVNSLRHVHIEDEHLGQLPNWLQQHASRIETLDIVGKEELLGRCERNEEDWHIIREIARVYTYLPGRFPFFSYTRTNDFFCKYQRQGVYAHAYPSTSAASVHQKVASAPTSSESNKDTAPRPAQAHFFRKGHAQAHDTDRKYMEGKFVMALLIGLIYTFYFTFNLDPSVALYLSILYFITVFALFKFL